MERYLIDTNIVSDYFSASIASIGMQLMDVAFDNTPKLSVITEIELLSWNTTEMIEEKVKGFISDSEVLSISPEVIRYCVAIRRNKKIKTPDAIIAATALANGLTLITNNEKDFKGIIGLKIINPYSLT